MNTVLQILIKSWDPVSTGVYCARCKGNTRMGYTHNSSMNDCSSFRLMALQARNVNSPDAKRSVMVNNSIRTIQHTGTARLLGYTQRPCFHTHFHSSAVMYKTSTEMLAMSSRLERSKALNARLDVEGLQRAVSRATGFRCSGLTLKAEGSIENSFSFCCSRIYRWISSRQFKVESSTNDKLKQLISDFFRAL